MSRRRGAKLRLPVAEASQVPADVAPPAEPLNFPVEASRPAAEPLPPLTFPIDATQPPPPAPPAFPDNAAQPSLPAPFPVAELPGLPTQPPATPPPTAEAAESPESAEAAEPTEPVAPPAPWRLLLPPVLTAVAALMTVGGLFLPLFRVQQQLSLRRPSYEAQVSMTQTVWGTRIEVPGQEAAERAGAPVGIPLILVVIVLFVATFVAFTQPGRGVARRLVAAGAVFTAGVVTTIGMSRFEWANIPGAEELDVVTTLGMWLLILATVLVAVAAVVAYLPGWRQTAGDDWADPTLAYADTPTPPTGVAITLLPPDPDDDQRP